jgi:hypothetical protein
MAKSNNKKNGKKKVGLGKKVAKKATKGISKRMAAMRKAAGYSD